MATFFLVQILSRVFLITSFTNTWIFFPPSPPFAFPYDRTARRDAAILPFQANSAFEPLGAFRALDVNGGMLLTTRGAHRHLDVDWMHSSTFPPIGASDQYGARLSLEREPGAEERTWASCHDCVPWCGCGSNTSTMPLCAAWRAALSAGDDVNRLRVRWVSGSRQTRILGRCAPRQRFDRQLRRRRRLLHLKVCSASRLLRVRCRLVAVSASISAARPPPPSGIARAVDLTSPGHVDEATVSASAVPPPPSPPPSPPLPALFSSSRLLLSS